MKFLCFVSCNGRAVTLRFDLIGGMHASGSKEGEYKIIVDGTSFLEDGLCILPVQFETRSDANDALFAILQAMNDSMNIKDSYGVLVDGDVVTVLR